MSRQTEVKTKEGRKKERKKEQCKCELNVDVVLFTDVSLRMTSYRWNM